MADPKFVIAVGGCGIDGGVYHSCYNALGGIDKVIPVHMYIPGCPPRPEAIAYGVYILLQSLANPAPQNMRKILMPSNQKG
jgi:NADH:ubiquinone oxidoreductase subunit B-like Fe-S oxidoreductase